MAEIHLAGARLIDQAALTALGAHAAKRDEPNLVAAIFRSGGFRKAIVDAMGAHWSSVDVTTVFIHKRPMVAFSCGGESTSCELGDAVVIYRERIRPGQERIQSVLFQAKLWDQSERGWVSTDRDQHALYRHWPPFKIAGGPARVLHLPPGDYGRVLGLSPGIGPNDVPRVSPRRATEPGCALESGTWLPTLGTIGRALRGLIRFEVGEQIRSGDWEVVLRDIIGRVAPDSPGGSFPPGPRGGRTTRASAPLGEGFDWLISSVASGPPPSTAEAQLTDDERPMTILLIDATEAE